MKFCTEVFASLLAITIKLSPPIKNVKEFFFRKNFDIFEYNSKIIDEISYGELVFLLELRSSTSKCIIETCEFCLPFTKPKILCSLFNIISFFFPSCAFKFASNGDSAYPIEIVKRISNNFSSVF